jgi:hypothetical protein
MRFFYSCEIVKQIISLFGLTVLKDLCTSYVQYRISWIIQSGGERIRTDDPLRARQMLSQLSYTPNDNLLSIGPEWSRTTDLTIISRTL